MGPRVPRDQRAAGAVDDRKLFVWDPGYAVVRREPARGGRGRAELRPSQRPSCGGGRVGGDCSRPGLRGKRERSCTRRPSESPTLGAATGASVTVDKTRFLTDESDDDHPVVIALPDLPARRLHDGGAAWRARAGLPRSLAGRGRRGRNRAPPPECRGCRIDRAMRHRGAEAPRCRDGLRAWSDSRRSSARSAKPLPQLRSVLPERSGGPLMPASEAGPLPPLPAPERRADIAETRGKRDGASIGERMTWQAEADGTGKESVTLDAGCHTLQLFALDLRTGHPGRRGKLDLDAEMRRGVGRAAPRAGPNRRARCCLIGMLRRVDAGPRRLHRLPAELHRLGGTLGVGTPGAPTLGLGCGGPQARMAHVLQARHIVSLPREAVMLAQGGSGTTPVPLSLEPGGLLPRARHAREGGGARHRSARAGRGDRRIGRPGIDTTGAVVAFCAGEPVARARGGAGEGHGAAGVGIRTLPGAVGHLEGRALRSGWVALAVATAASGCGMFSHGGACGNGSQQRPAPRVSLG